MTQFGSSSKPCKDAFLRCISNSKPSKAGMTSVLSSRLASFANQNFSRFCNNEYCPVKINIHATVLAIGVQK